MIFVLQKKVRQNFFPHISFVAVVGFGIRDPGWIKISIQDKHSGSATLLLRDHYHNWKCSSHKEKP
jgi:hypothetical protein